MQTTKKEWDWEIKPRTSYWDWSLKQLWSYRHLTSSLVRRDFLLNYQQTVLGPVWVLLQPIMTLFVFVIVFGKFVGVSTGTTPTVLFYFAGIVLWNFFSDSFSGTSSTFRENSQIFSKVYFPRIIMPIAVISTHFMRFLIQLTMLLLIIAYYWLFMDFDFQLNAWLLTLPFVILLVGTAGLALGLFFSVVTAKYRDMLNLVSLGVRLMMFITPVIYPLATVPENIRWVLQLNPLTSLFELFRLALLGEGVVSYIGLAISTVLICVAMVAAILFFNKQSDKLIDVV